MHVTAISASDTQAAGADWIAKSVKEVAGLIGVSERFLWNFVRTGEIDSFKVGRSRLIPRTAVDAFVDRLVAEDRASRISAA